MVVFRTPFSACPENYPNLAKAATLRTTPLRSRGHLMRVGFWAPCGSETERLHAGLGARRLGAGEQRQALPGFGMRGRIQSDSGLPRAGLPCWHLRSAPKWICDSSEHVCQQSVCRVSLLGNRLQRVHLLKNRFRRVDLLKVNLQRVPSAGFSLPEGVSAGFWLPEGPSPSGSRFPAGAPSGSRFSTGAPSGNRFSSDSTLAKPFLGKGTLWKPFLRGRTLAKPFPGESPLGIDELATSPTNRSRARTVPLRQRPPRRHRPSPSQESRPATCPWYQTPHRWHPSLPRSSRCTPEHRSQVSAR